MGRFRNFVNRLIRARPITNSKVSVQTVPATSFLTTRNNIYDIPEVREAIHKSANHFARIRFNHIKYDNRTGYSEKLKDSIYYCLNVRANLLQSAFKFKQSLATQYFLGKDVFIRPVWRVDSVRPILDSIHLIDYAGYEIGLTTPGLDVVIKFYTSDGKSVMYYFKDLGFIQRFPLGLNPTNNMANQNTIKDWLQVVTGIKNAILKGSDKVGDIHLVVLESGVLKESAYRKKIAEIERQVEESKHGIIFIGGASQKDVMAVNPNTEQPQFRLVGESVDNIYRFFDSNAKIVGGTASDIEFEQYVDSAIKPLVEDVEQELTHLLFSRESIDKGNYIEANMVDLTISTLSAKTTWFKEMLYAGVLMQDEAREEIGKPPLPDGMGKVPMINKNTQPIETLLKGGAKDDSQTSNNEPTDDNNSGGTGGGAEEDN